MADTQRQVMKPMIAPSEPYASLNYRSCRRERRPDAPSHKKAAIALPQLIIHCGVSRLALPVEGNTAVSTCVSGGATS